MRWKHWLSLLALLGCACFAPCAAGAEDGLVISEVMTHNQALWQLQYCDYVELYNGGTETARLSDYALLRAEGDKASPLPARELEPGEYALLLCDGEALGFNLPKAGCTLLLTREGVEIDRAEVPAMESGAVWMREQGVRMQPSPGFANTAEGCAAWWQQSEHTLIISEAVSCNVSLREQDGEYYDLIELENCGNVAVKLSDYYLSDRTEQPLLWQLPDVTLEPGKCYVVYASGLGGRQASFKLSAKGETLTLMRADGLTMDMLSLPALRADESFGRYHGVPMVYGEPSIGKLNTEGALGVSVAPRISPATGLYAGEVEVTIAGEGELHFTLDGSEPTLNSPVYTGEPIRLTETTAVRALAAQDGLLPSSSATQQYAFGMEQYHLPALLISGADRDLLGDSGIYANYLRRKKEAAIYLTLIENGEEKFGVDCGLKIHGNGSRKLPKKSFQVRFRSQYGMDELDYPLFEHSDATTFTSLILRSGSEDSSRSLFRDEFLASLTRDTMPEVLYQDYKPVNLFINGEYFGIYFIRERTDETYVTEHLGGAEEDVDMVNGWTTQEYGDISNWRTLSSYCSRHDLSGDEEYQKVASQISVEGFIDYYIARAYTGDRDYCNIRFCRSRGGDGLWRVIDFDLDWGFTITKSPLYALLGTVKDESAENNVVITALLKNDGFRTLFLQRLAMHLRTTYAPERVLQLLDGMIDELGGDIQRNQARWGYTMERWETSVQLLRDFVLTMDGARVDKMVTDARYTFRLTDEETTEIFGDLCNP